MASFGPPSATKFFISNPGDTIWNQVAPRPRIPVAVAPARARTCRDTQHSRTSQELEWKKYIQREKEHASVLPPLQRVDPHPEGFQALVFPGSNKFVPAATKYGAPSVGLRVAV